MNATRTRWLTLFTGAALAAMLVWQAWSQHVTPADLPSGDAAYYSAQALELRALLLNGAWGALVERLTWPELHPPLHALLMALWSLIFGVSQASLRSYGAVVTTIALVVLLPAMGHRMAPRGGAVAGMLAALTLLLGPYQPVHLFTTMTEPTHLLTWVLVLGLAAHSWQHQRPWTSLLVGAALCDAALVRYSNLPLLLTPLVLADLLTRWPTPWRTRALRWACWLAPTAVVFGAWYGVEPALPRAIAAFLVTAQPATSPGLMGWLWTPWIFAERFIGSWLLALPLMFIFTAGLVPLFARRELSRSSQLGGLALDLRLGRPAGLALVQLSVLVGLLALSAHPYKVTRNMSALAPLLVFAAMLPWLGSRVLWRGRGVGTQAVLAVAGLLLVAQWGLQPGKAGAHTKPSGALVRMTNDHPAHLAQPGLAEVLALLRQGSRGSHTLLLRGWGYPEPLVHSWAADIRLEAQLVTHWDPAALVAEPGNPSSAAVALVRPPSAPKKRGERDDIAQVAATLETAGCRPEPHARTSEGWQVRWLRCPMDNAESAHLTFTREDHIRRELDQR